MTRPASGKGAASKNNSSEAGKTVNNLRNTFVTPTNGVLSVQLRKKPKTAVGEFANVKSNGGDDDFLEDMKLAI